MGGFCPSILKSLESLETLNDVSSNRAQALSALLDTKREVPVDQLILLLDDDSMSKNSDTD